MTNKEYWTGKVADEVLQPENLAIANGKPEKCSRTHCDECDISIKDLGDCEIAAQEWLNAEAPPQTRLEWLRYASVEEVAKMIHSVTGPDGYCIDKPECESTPYNENECLKCVVEWLNKPINEAPAAPDPCATCKAAHPQCDKCCEMCENHCNAWQTCGRGGKREH